MRLPRFEYVKPASLKEGLAILQEFGKDAGILAGGTDLLVNMKYGVVRPEKVVSIRTIPELCSISEDGRQNLRIGACVPLSALAENALISEKFPALRDAIKSVASRHIRNMATLGGNICLATRCWYYNQSKLWRDARKPCHRAGGSVCYAISGSKRCLAINNSDTTPALMALNAQIVALKKGHERVIPIADFFRDDGMRHTVLEPEEIVTAILVPEIDPAFRTVFIKTCSRRGIDFAIGDIAAALSGTRKKVTAARIIIGSISSAPVSLGKAAGIIMESGLTDKSIEAAAEAARSELGPLTNIFTPAGYKRDLVRALVKRALVDIKKKLR